MAENPLLFTRAEAHAVGVTRSTLERHVRVGDIHRVLHGVYAARPVHALAERARALARTRPDVILCRATAAAVLGVDLLPPGADPLRWPVEAYVPRGAAPVRRPLVRGLQAFIDPAEIVEADGVRLTSPTRIAADMGRYEPRLMGVAAVDALLHARLVGLADLWRCREAIAGQRNAARLQAVLEVADGRAESRGESWLRVRLHDAGMTMFEPQVVVMAGGRFVARLDLGDKRRRVGVEYDGEEHHTDPVDVAHDQRRRADAARVGWSVWVARRGDVLGDCRPLLTAVGDDLCARGWDGAGVRLPPPAWIRRAAGA